jgi:hypothetical protein
MEIRIIIALLAMCLLAINWLTMDVVQSNAFAGLYPPDGDSIGIPIFGTWFASLVLAPFFFLVVWLPLSRFAARIVRKSRVHKAAVILALGLQYLFGVVLALVGASIWADPDHWPISVEYCALAAWFVLAGVFFLGKVSNGTSRG